MFGQKPKTVYSSPLVPNNHPEIDTSDLFDNDGIHKYQSLLGVLQWTISLGRFDICTAVIVGWCVLLTMSDAKDDDDWLLLVLPWPPCSFASTRFEFQIHVWYLEREGTGVDSNMHQLEVHQDLAPATKWQDHLLVSFFQITSWNIRLWVSSLFATCLVKGSPNIIWKKDISIGWLLSPVHTLTITVFQVGYYSWGAVHIDLQVLACHCADFWKRCFLQKSETVYPFVIVYCLSTQRLHSTTTSLETLHAFNRHCDFYF